MDYQEIMEGLGRLDANLFQTDFFLTWDKSEHELKQILYGAEALRYLRHHNISSRCFDSGLAVSIFRDKSTRTRFSFSSAANSLGLGVQELEEGKSQITHGETVRETANMISFLTEIIGIRDDVYLGTGHADMKTVAEALDDGFNAGVLSQRPSVINLQCDIDHPTQSMADLMQLMNHFGSLQNLKGKKIAVTWAYSPSYGKPLSVPQGIIGLMTRFGMNVSLAYPEGYHLIPDVIEIAKKNAVESDGNFDVIHSMDAAFEDADIVYPKSWAPYAIMEKRTELMRNNDSQGLKRLEEECLAQNARFKSWECTEQKMKLTRDGQALYMHCLPADISNVSCEQGEVEETVFEKYRIATYKQAAFKPYIIASIMVNTRFEDPVRLLQKLKKRNTKRMGF
ncbi:MAG: knotted carbamoyltransferase YgeW [Proteobacteria bacterium]|nr:knotted carbamoyltransferase YgeW [Pseudomonadota bacterium]